MATVIAFGDPKAAVRYSATLMVETDGKSFWQRKFYGSRRDGEISPYPVQVLTDLEKSEGEKITYDLLMEKTQQPVEGDEVLENKEAEMKFYTDYVYIDQMRGGQNIGGRMSRKRTVHKLREKAKFNESKWWAQVFDQIHFMYGSGARGVNGEFQFPSTYSGFANNALSAPDSEHIFYAGGTTKATLASTNTLSLTDVEKVLAGAKMMNNIRTTGGTDGSTKTPKIQPIQIDAAGDSLEHYVLLMNPWQAYNLRTASGSTWLDFQKAAATAEGSKNKIFKGGLGLINGVVLQEHESLIRFSDYGSGSDVAAARALFLGAQAMVVAWGSPGNGMRLGWHEETRDNGNQSIISTSAIFGCKKVTYNGKDFGVYAVDSAAADPRA